MELADVLLLADDGRITTGNPLVPGAKVMASVVEQGLHPKVIIFKYKSKVRYHRRIGHRQPFTRLAIEEITPAGGAEAKRSRRKSAEPKQEESEG